MFWSGVALGFLVTAIAAWIVVSAHQHKHRARTKTAERRALDAEHLAKLGAMTAGLAHEIRNPLSTIGLNAQLLAEALDDLPVEQSTTDTLTKRIATLRREVDRLAGILEDFLRYAGEIKLQPVETNLVNLAEELADFFLPQAQRHNIALTIEPSATPVTAQVDPSYIKQALLNLLLNATQAMDAHTDSASDNKLIITVQSTDAGDNARISVRDTGPGMTPETLEQIFTPYFSTRPSGAGLGLPITKRIIDAHQGIIDVTSTPVQGTTFTITLPTTQPSIESPKAPSPCGGSGSTESSRRGPS